MMTMVVMVFVTMMKMIDNGDCYRNDGNDVKGIVLIKMVLILFIAIVMEMTEIYTYDCNGTGNDDKENENQY